MSHTTITVHILDREYQVNCKTGEVDELTSTAKYLDSEMRKIRDSGKVLGMDRIAIMAALNISHEYLTLSQDHTDNKADSTKRITTLTTKIERSMVRQKEFSVA